MTRRIPLAAALAALAMPTTALASAEGPGTPQATAANATFLSNAPAPASGGGICVIDTGADTDTDLGPALASRVAQIGGVPGDPSDLGAISDTGDTLPKHGTYVAGVIASQVDGVGTSGIWPAAKIYSNRVFAGGGVAAVNDYIRALSWCEQAGVKVINLSLSGLSGTTTSQRSNLNDKIAEARSAPYYINVVAAAGNNGSSSTVGYPALAEGVFAVGGSDDNGRLAAFSNRGVGLDIATFGTDVCVTTNRGTRLASGSGTSFAAPVVSAVLAALRSYDPALTPDRAEALLVNGADIVDGVKVMNAARAFRADPAVAAMASSAPLASPGAPVTSPCLGVPESPTGSSGSAGSAGRTETAEKRSDAEIITVASAPTAPPMVASPMPDSSTKLAGRLAGPTLRSIKHRHGVLTLRIGGFEVGETAVFRVRYRNHGSARTETFRRNSAVLRVRLPNWSLIRVQLSRPDGTTSRTLTVRPNDEF